MKLRLVIVILLSLSQFFANINLGKAQWSAIDDSGYAATTDWHGTDVPVGENVTATAGTIDLNVTHIRFIWHDPNDTIVQDVFVDVLNLTTPEVPDNVPQEVIDWAEENPGITYLYAQSWYEPDAVGEWGIQAIFYNITSERGNSTTRIRATSFNAVPEVPYGTIAIVTMMFSALVIYTIKRRIPPIKFRLCRCF
jgi:hypothetical protein